MCVEFPHGISFRALKQLKYMKQTDIKKRRHVSQRNDTQVKTRMNIFRFIFCNKDIRPCIFQPRP